MQVEKFSDEFKVHRLTENQLKPLKETMSMDGHTVILAERKLE